MTSTKYALIPLLILALISSGCSSSQVVTDLEVAVDAVSVALPILAGAAGFPPSLVTQATVYLSAVNGCLSQASTILAGAGTDGAKSAQIAAACATSAAPAVPAQYQALANAISAVAGDLARFLAGLPQPVAMARTAGAGHVTKFSARDTERLRHANALAIANATRLALMQGK